MIIMDKKEVVNFLNNNAISYIRSTGFTHGEDQAYIELSRSIARSIEESSLPAGRCYEVSECGSSINIFFKEKKLALVSIFRDSFSLWENTGHCPGYCNREFSQFWGARCVCEEIFREEA